MQWINANDKIPGRSSLECDYSDTVIVFGEDGRYAFGVYFFNKEKWRIMPSVIIGSETFKVIAWMSYPPKPDFYKPIKNQII